MIIFGTTFEVYCQCYRQQKQVSQYNCENTVALGGSKQEYVGTLLHTVLCKQNFEPWDDNPTPLEFNVPSISVWQKGRQVEKQTPIHTFSYFAILRA